MCEGSIHVANREAKAKERLVLTSIPSTGYLLWYPARKEKTRKAVCIRKPVEAIVAKFELQPQFAKGWKNATDRRFQMLASLHGKKNLAVTLNRYNQIVIDVNGWKVVAHWNWLVPGTKVSIGYPAPTTPVAGHREQRSKAGSKVTGNKGVAVVNQAIDEAINTTPTPISAGSTTKAGRKVRAVKA